MASRSSGATKTPRPSFSSPPIKPALHHNPYIDMTSPVATSASPPSLAADGPYMTMTASAGGARSGTHTRSSSFGEDVVDGYVPMAPQSLASSLTSRDGTAMDDAGAYLDMQLGNIKNHIKLTIETWLNLKYDSENSIIPDTSPCSSVKARKFYRNHQD